MDPDLRVERLLNVLKSEEGDFALVGSSMGGYVSLVASEFVNAKGILLLAPAIYIPGYKIQKYKTSQQHFEIVHGWSDEVIPHENSIKFAKDAKCSLHLIDGDHRLNSSIEVVAEIFDKFIGSIQCSGNAVNKYNLDK
jgi:surfactin synthase thioesterase subunit